ncbi:MAG: transposase [Nitrospirae bacterium]|nr:transposase [Candidatus Manganitrophaceae bacterium]
MPRIARIVVPGHAYHVTQRGNYRQKIFRNDEDRLKYLSWIGEYSRKYRLSIWAYCLMDNHVHFIVQPQKEDSLAKVFSVAHMRYSQYFNKEGSASGHLWQGRFYSCLLDEPYLMAAMRYVERNPVRAKIVKKPWGWKWSSAAAHIGGTEGQEYVVDLKDSLGISAKSWRKYIGSEENAADVEAIRRKTMVGRPLGEEGFIRRLSQKLGRAITVLPRGRPKKTLK